MSKLTNKLLLLVTVSLLISSAYSYCSSACFYQLNAAFASYTQQCSPTTPSQCVGNCDPYLFNPTASGGVCSLLVKGPFNDTIEIDDDLWLKDYGITSSKTASSISVSGDTWIQFSGTTSIHTRLLSIPQPHYGMVCRALFHIQNGFSPSLRFAVNNTYSENVQNVPLTDTRYNHNEWIFTTDFIRFREQFTRIQISRTDNNVLGAGDAAAFSDVRCYIAYCVPDCLSCTGLKDCEACSSPKILNPVTRYCQTTCPRGMFGTSGVCQFCDPLCDSCTAAGATNCNNCTDSGPYQAFLMTTTCYQTCPGIHVNNYLTHKCDCPSVGYSKLAFPPSCVACPTNCAECTAAGVCTLCKIGFFMTNGSTTCSSTCPPTQYQYWIYDIAVCYLCDATACVNCVNTSTTCTSCNFATNDRFLYNFTCLTLCPDGYEGNRVTWKCDLCPLGMYSYENVCYSYCPLHYYANDNIRACVLPGGYPLNMTVQVQGANTLKFTIPLDLGLKTSTLTLLNTTWQTYISLTFITESKNKLVLNPRLLQQSYSMPLMISNAIISNKSIILYTTSIPAEYLIYSHSFTVRFQDNLLSPKDVIYQITTMTALDDNPWVVREYFDLNLKPYYLIGIFLAVFGLLVILMRTKYIYRILIEYIHSIQLLGLTYYAIYPHSIHIFLYSFTMGLDFANFTFIYNVPQKFIQPCKECTCLISYSFASGDMNWLRLVGSFLVCLIAMLIFCGIVYLFKCSRPYAQFFINLVIDLILIKTLHSWFASLVYSGLNFNYNGDDNDMFILGMHALSYFVLLPVLYTRIKMQYQNKFVNISFLFLVIFIVLVTLASLAPTLICALLMLTTAVQWGLIFGLNITQQQKPAVISQKQGQQQVPFILRFHNHLLRSIKPLTAFLVACILMIKDQTIPIALVSTILSILLITILVTTYFLYDHHQKESKVQIKPPKSNQINETKQDLALRQQKYQNNERETQYRDNSNAKPNIKIYDEDDMDDDVVANKFRNNKKNQSGGPGNQDIYKSSELFKNVD